MLRCCMIASQNASGFGQPAKRQLMPTMAIGGATSDPFPVNIAFIIAKQEVCQMSLQESCFIWFFWLGGVRK